MRTLWLESGVARRLRLAAVVLVAISLASLGVASAGNVTVPVTAFWDFDGDSALEDQTGHGHHLILPGGSLNPGLSSVATPSTNGWTPNGLAGTVTVFDASAYFDIPNSVYSGGDFTFVTAALRPTAAGGYDTILASTRFRYQNINDSLGGGINAPGGSFGSPAHPLNADDWYLIALRYTDSTRVLESWAVTNSNTLGAPVLTGSATAPGLGNASDFRLGYDGVSLIGGTDGWAGQLDFIAFHDGALSNAQIGQILDDFNNSPGVLPPPPPPAIPTAKWDFNAANPLEDRTGNGHNLTNPGGSKSPTFVPATPSANNWDTWESRDGNVASFDGNDYLAVPNTVYEGDDFTVIVAHMMPNAATGYDTILASSRFRYQNIKDNLGGGINSPGGTFGSPAYPLDPDEWYFTALRYNNSNMALESFAVTATDILGLPVMQGSANLPGIGNALNWRIGGDDTSLIGGFDGWPGEIDFVLFYNQYLEDWQIQDVLSQFVVPEPASLALLACGLAAWRLRRRRRRRSA